MPAHPETFQTSNSADRSRTIHHGYADHGDTEDDLSAMTVLRRVGRGGGRAAGGRCGRRRSWVSTVTVPGSLPSRGTRLLGSRGRRRREGGLGWDTPGTRAAHAWERHQVLDRGRAAGTSGAGCLALGTGSVEQTGTPAERAIHCCGRCRLLVVHGHAGLRSQN